MKIFLGADHAGFLLKEKLKKVLVTKKIRFVDLGTSSVTPIDYPTIAAAVAKQVVKSKNHRGVLVCGSG